MKPVLNLVTIWTDDIKSMRDFYNRILGFEIANDLGDYVEFKNSGVRFALCQRSVMYPFSEAFKQKTSGQAFELAFPCETVEELEETCKKFIKNGVRIVQAPTDMPWQQRTSLFCDPDGNIHEIFTEL